MKNFSEKEIFNRTELLLGWDAMERIAKTRVIIFGIGGVGSWCAESLVRSGIRHLTIVDSDRVSVTNINRQAMATTETVGRVKVEVMKDRLLSINPHAKITALPEIYSAETSESFHLEEYDFVVDAIDSLSNKLELILHATKAVGKNRFFSSMGAALKMDASQIRVSEFWEIDGCPLARALRKRMKKQERFPACKFRCVWSPEVLDGGISQRTQEMNSHEEAVQSDCVPGTETPTMWDARKAQINGSMSHITAIFGFTLAGEILKKI